MTSFRVALRFALCTAATLSVPAIAFADGHAAGSGPIQHVVIVVQEARSFDDLFCSYPGANAAQCARPLRPCAAPYERCANFPSRNQAMQSRAQSKMGRDVMQCNEQQWGLSLSH